MALKGLEDLNIASFYELNEHSKEVYMEVKAMLKALPSAQPSVSKTETVEDCISRQAMINEIDLHVGILYDNLTLVESFKLLVRSLPSAQTELENKIRAIGYTGREGRIYIGGRLFAVRELPQ